MLRDEPWLHPTGLLMRCSVLFMCLCVLWCYARRNDNCLTARQATPTQNTSKYHQDPGQRQGFHHNTLQYRLRTSFFSFLVQIKVFHQSGDTLVGPIRRQYPYGQYGEPSQSLPPLDPSSISPISMKSEFDLVWCRPSRWGEVKAVEGKLEYLPPPNTGPAGRAALPAAVPAATLNCHITARLH